MNRVEGLHWYVSQAWLTEEQVVAIRVQRAAGASLNELAADFGISAQHVSRIVTGTAWRETGGPLTFGHPAARRDPDPWFQMAFLGLSWESAKMALS